MKIPYLDANSTAYILPHRVRRALWTLNLCLLAILGGLIVLAI